MENFLEPRLDDGVSDGINTVYVDPLCMTANEIFANICSQILSIKNQNNNAQIVINAEPKQCEIIQKMSVIPHLLWGIPVIKCKEYELTEIDF
jgi:hypothetical protein